MYNKEIGQQGEQMVEAYLEEKGYIILERNYRKRVGEIDLIATSPEKEEIVFIEVKTRSSKVYGHPEEAVDQRKLQKIQKTALLWLQENKKIESHWRIDVLSLELHPKIKITHFENVTL